MSQDIVQPTRKIIFLAHGSRNESWCNIFEDGITTMNQHLESDASLAYMELAKPSLESVIDDHYKNGLKKFEIVPLFFAAGRHLLFDVPLQIEKLNTQYSGIEIVLKEAVGHNEIFWQFLGEMISSSIQGDTCEQN